jgi:hypothetical protein
MDILLSYLEKWQTLVGSVIGGLMALGVALLVAYKARRHEDLAAAMLVVGNLVTVRTASRVLKELSAADKIDDQHLAYWFSEKLVRRRITLSPVFEASRIRLMPIDVHLAAHLELFQVLFTDVVAKLDTLANDYAAFDLSSKTTRPVELLRTESKIVYQGFEAAVRHARCAERILTVKVLSNYPTFHGIRMALFPSKEERECQCLLRGE